jgi:tetratricopeptide (TPR) repeat protein
MIARRYPEALAQFHKTLELAPDFQPAHFKLSWLFAETGHFAEAVGELQKYSPTPGSWSSNATGYNEITLVALPQQGDWEAYAALTFALRGNRDKAFEYLNKAFSARDTNLPECVRFPALDPLRSDPRYTAFMQRLELPDH